MVGALPGAGADIAAWVSYAVAKRRSATPEAFGEGHDEGIVEAGASNNAALSAAWVPTLVFGIPGDSVTAVVIGVLYLKGLEPGPIIFIKTPELVYAIFLAFLLANLLLIPLGWMVIRLSRHLLRVPQGPLRSTDLGRGAGLVGRRGLWTPRARRAAPIGSPAVLEVLPAPGAPGPRAARRGRRRAA